MRRLNLILGLTLAPLIGLPLAGCSPVADNTEPVAPTASSAGAQLDVTGAEGVVVAPAATTTPEIIAVAPPAYSKATADADDTGSEGDGSEAPVSAAKMSLSETFTSTELGVAIDYPVDWRIEDNGTMFMLKSYAEDPGPGTDGVSPTLTKIDILPLPGFPLDLDARVAQIKQELDAINEEEEITLMSGERAVWLRGEGGMAGDTGILVTIVGDELYHLQAYGNPEPLKAIGFTFRAAE